MPERKAAYFGGRFTLELDDKKPVGFVTSIDGGHFKADPVPSLVGASNVITRYAGKPKYDDITITCGMAMSPAFWKWLQASLDNKPARLVQDRGGRGQGGGGRQRAPPRARGAQRGGAARAAVAAGVVRRDADEGAGGVVR